MVKAIKTSAVILMMSFGVALFASGGSLDRCLDRCNALGMCLAGATSIGVGLGTGGDIPTAGGCAAMVGGMTTLACREKCRRMYPPPETGCC